MAAPQHVRAAPLARALRATATATAPAPIKSQGISRRALLALSEPQLRQLALDLGQVHCTREVLFASVTLPACLCLTHL
jgi:23S rRNA (adenine2503-C2)-methyltransferase